MISQKVHGMADVAECNLRIADPVRVNSYHKILLFVLVAVIGSHTS